MTVRPVASATARIPAGRRPSPMGVISTIVAIPVACPSRASSIDALGVRERLARHAGRVEEQVVVRVDDAEGPDGARPGDADDVGLRHAASPALTWACMVPGAPVRARAGTRGAAAHRLDRLASTAPSVS